MLKAWESIKDYEQHGDEFDLDILIEDVDELSKIYNLKCISKEDHFGKIVILKSLN